MRQQCSLGLVEHVARNLPGPIFPPEDEHLAVGLNAVSSSRKYRLRTVALFFRWSKWGFPR